MIDLDYGATYFEVTYADKDRTMPGIRPLVYIGTNLIGDETEKTYYFQDTVSVQVQGIRKETEDFSESNIISCKAKYIGTDIVSIEQAASVLSQSAKIAKALGYPKITKVGGNWNW